MPTFRSALVSLSLVLLATSASAQKSGGILRVYHNDNPPTASLHEEVTIGTLNPFMAVFNNLVIYDQTVKRNADDTIVPDLATKWGWDDTRTNLTFTLREGVTWHDGKPFTSADVKFSMEEVWKKLNPRAQTLFASVAGVPKPNQMFLTMKSRLIA